ncbi:MAG: glutaminase [Actinomycetota bacterium]|nr:glutaminase [Actinomycetota bacterium]
MERAVDLDLTAVPGPVVTRSPVLEYLGGLLEEYRALDDGEVATYIPELRRADPEWFGICVVTADGHVYEVGDTGLEFTIQSISKPFVFGMALEDQGRDAVLERVGVEPSGNAFNSIIVDDRSRPFNPMVNAGAIVATGLIDPLGDLSPMDRIVDAFSRYAGRPLELDETVYRSESITGDRNRAIAYLMRSFDMLRGDVDAVIDAYFRQCSLLVSCRDLATMAATLANRGTNPITGEQALEPRYVENVLSVMSTCGMYDYAGEWVYTVGLPAKSGVAGGVVAVLPGQLGIGVFSPRLDERGNSSRGIRVCQRMAAEFDLHPLRFQPEVRAVVRRSYRCGQTRSNRIRTPDEYDELSRHGDSVAVFELQGDLFFGSTERLFRRVVEDIAGVEAVVLDCKRVGNVDGAAIAMLANLRSALDDIGCVLVVADVGPVDALAEIAMRAFVDADTALEWCEDRVLLQAGSLTSLVPEELGIQELLQGLTSEELAAVERVAEVRKVAAGEVVFREGDQADAIFFVLAGLVSVRLPLGGLGRDRRLATLGAGVAVGEMAFLDEGRRSADVVAEEESVLARLSIEDLRQIGDELPGVLAKFSANLARNLSGRLRRANEQVRMLAQ